MRCEAGIHWCRVFFNLEQIRRKDALVKQTLAEKDDLVADLLAIPREDFQHIADMASTASSNADSHSLDITDRLLATVFQVTPEIAPDIICFLIFTFTR